MTYDTLVQLPASIESCQLVIHIPIGIAHLSGTMYFTSANYSFSKIGQPTQPLLQYCIVFLNIPVSICSGIMPILV